MKVGKFLPVGALMKKTKIICTLGPACENKETFAKMAESGMDVVRLNFSHGTHADHAKKIAMVDEILYLVKPLYTIQAKNGPTIPIEKMFAPKVVNPP